MHFAFLIRNFNTPDIARQPYWKFFLKLVGIVYLLMLLWLFVVKYRAVEEQIFAAALGLTIFSIFFLVLVINVILLILTYKKISELGKASDMTENTEFNKEQGR